MNRAEHLLACLAEECDEVGKNCMKALRFGLQDGYPGQPFTNAQEIAKELTDLIAVANMLVEAKLIPAPDIKLETIGAKQAKVEKFMAYAETIGALTGGQTDGE